MKRMPVSIAAATLVVAVATLARPADAQSRRFDEFPETQPRPGETAPDFTLETLEGETFTLSEAFAERPVVIEFGSYT